MSGFWKVALGSVLLTGALLVGLTALESHRRTERLAQGPSQLENLTLGAVARRPLWVALETQEFSSEDSDETVWRASVYDLATGALLARKSELSWRACTSAGDGQLWCHGSDEDLSVVALPGLEVLHPSVEVQQKVGQKLMEAHRLITTPTGALVSLLADGRKMQLDPRSLALSPAEPVVEPPQERDPFSDVSACRIADTARMGFCRFTPGGDTARVDSGEGYLRPERLRVQGLAGRMVLLTRTSLDDRVSARQLVVLDERLSEVLRVSLVPGEPTLIQTHYLPETNTLVLGFRPPMNETIAIELERGRERFRIRH